MVRQKYHQAVVRLQEPLQKENKAPAVKLPDVSSLELVDALVTMCDAVYELQNANLDPMLLLEVLDDHDRVIIASLSKRVQERRLGLSLPPTKDDMKLSGLCIELHTHMANGYKSAIPNLGNGEHLRGATDQFLRAACGAISHLKLSLLSAYERESRYLELEITENSLIKDVEGAIRTLHALKDLGVHIAIDDFGIGYSNLSYLKKLPFDTLKIDQSFLRDITSDPDDAAIVTAIIGMADSMNLGVIAEGVETKEQQDFLRKRSCVEFQGYYFSHPLSVYEMTHWLQDFNHTDAKVSA